MIQAKGDYIAYLDDDDEWLSDVVHYELIPLLEEYWFDETDTLSEWKRKLEDSIR